MARARKASEEGRTLDQVAALYRQALDVCPSHPEALNNLGDTLEHQGRFEDAISAYHRAVKAYQDAEASANLRALPHFGLGDVLRKMGRDGEALYWYRKGLEIDPNDRETLEAVRELTRDDPPGLIDSRSIGRALDDDSRSTGVLAAVELSENTLPFAFDSAELLPEARRQIGELAYALMDRLGAARSLGVLSVGPPIARIAGHADSRGTEQYNYDLALRRAQGVAHALVSEYRIPPSRLVIESFGETRLKCFELAETCHQRNRRVEVGRPRD